MRIMPAKERRAIFEIYSFCREVDDIADEGGSRAVQLRDLDQWRSDIVAIYAGAPPARLGALAEAVREFDLRENDFLAVVDGMQMDVDDTIRAPDWATLDLYCDRVASAVGRLCVRIFGMDERPGVELAHHLGRALQLTNILRDIDEDASIGRLYLPREALLASDISTIEPAEVMAHPSIEEACAPVIERALNHFKAADAIIAASPRRAVRAPRIMGAAYRQILDRLIARGWKLPRERVRTSRWRLLLTLLRHAI
jgi:squalene synthase HpnD